MPKKGSKEELEVLDIAGISEEWDSEEDIRGRLRDGMPLLNPDSPENVQECCAVASVLIPVLTRMAVMNTKPLPPIDPLRSEIEILMTKNKRGDAPELGQDVIKSAWRVKKLCGFVKMKARREEVSTVP